MEERKFDFHKPEELMPYLDEVGRIKPRKETGLTRNEHCRMVKMVKRARHLALLPEGRPEKDEEEEK